MKSQTFPRRWLIAPVLALAFCSRGNSPSLTTPSNNSTSAIAGGDGLAGVSALGDVKIGTGPLEIVRLRMDRQTSAGASVLRQYADPGQSYPMNPGETIELWAEYPAVVVSPRFKVEWGDGAVENIGCGSCLLKHAYPSPGVYTVKASLDDRVSTTVTRTFLLDSREPAPVANSFVYSQAFTQGQSYLAGTSQFDGWNTFRASLNTGIQTFTLVAFSGSSSPTPLTCSNPAVVAQIANALRLATALGPTACDGHNWAVGTGCGPGNPTELYIDSGSCSCGAIYSLRPQIQNLNWGGFNSATCVGPSQTLTLTFTALP
jgi:hypothetical protein